MGKVRKKGAKTSSRKQKGWEEGDGPATARDQARPDHPPPEPAVSAPPLELFSKKLANYHIWTGITGMLFYVVPMYWAGVVQGLMWKQFDTDGFLQYPNFLETVNEIIPMYQFRAIGGTLYLIGVIMMIVNLIKTAKAGERSLAFP